MERAVVGSGPGQGELGELEKIGEGEGGGEGGGGGEGEGEGVRQKDLIIARNTEVAKLQAGNFDIISK